MKFFHGFQNFLSGIEMIAKISKFLFVEWYNCCLLHSVLHGCVINPCWLSCMFRYCTNYIELLLVNWGNFGLWRCSTFILPGSVLVTTQAQLFADRDASPSPNIAKEKSSKLRERNPSSSSSSSIVIPDVTGERSYSWLNRRYKLLDRPAGPHRVDYLNCHGSIGFLFRPISCQHTHECVRALIKVISVWIYLENTLTHSH